MDYGGLTTMKKVDLATLLHHHFSRAKPAAIVHYSKQIDSDSAGFVHEKPTTSLYCDAQNLAYYQCMATIF